MAKTQEATGAILSDGVPQKPLLFDTNPFEDERLDDLEFSVGHKDASYVPGYSEQKAENERRVRDGLPVIPMPRLQWVRIAKKGGKTVTVSDEGMLEWLRLGYRACGISDLEAHNFGFPPTAHVGADGLIRRQDEALFIVGDERADKNRVRQERINKDATNREMMSGASGEIYEDKSQRVHRTGSLEDFVNSELPSLE